jgi:hypothetical protein
MEKQTKKELRDKYKSRTVSGGVYCIKCSGNNDVWLRATTDMKSSENRFIFSQTINSCLEPCMAEAFKQYGASAFSLETLEVIQKKEAQTDKEFTEDVYALLELWEEKEDKKESA